MLGTTYAVYLLALTGVTLFDEPVNSQIVQAASSIPLSGVLLAMLERCSAMVLHIGLSMFVFVAVKGEGRFYLYPLAILLHALADAPACLYQQGVLTSLAMVEIYVLIVALAVLFGGRKLLQDYTPSTEPSVTNVLENTDSVTDV